MLDFYTKTNYGREDIYLSNEKTRELVYRLTGKKTVTREDLKVLEALTGRKAKQVINFKTF